MPIVGNGDAIDDVRWVAFSNRTVVMARDRTAAYITNAGDRDAANREMRGAHTFDLAAVGRGVTETDHVAHFSAFLLGRGPFSQVAFGRAACGIL